MSKAPLIYYVEDDEHIRDLTAYALHQAGMEVRAFHDGDGLVERCAAEPPDAVLLDIMLPGDDGLVLLQALRGNTATENMPIMMLTAKGTEFDKVVGLDAGADDYLTKPFSVEELLARLRVALRRVRYDTQKTDQEASVYQNGALKIDYAGGCAYRGEQEIHLTPIEYKLLCLLAKNTGKVLTHNYILSQVWGNSTASDTPSLRVFMATLRKKLETDPSHPQYIQTHIGVGYRMLRQKETPDAS